VRRSIKESSDDATVKRVIEELQSLIRSNSLDAQATKISHFLVSRLREATPDQSSQRHVLDAGRKAPIASDPSVKPSTDPVFVVAMALGIGREQGDYATEEIAQAVRLAHSPVVEAALKGRTPLAIHHEAQTVGLILKEYVAVHDDIFAGGVVKTLRRIIPIPGIFQAINFKAHAVTLALLAYSIDSIRTRVTTQGGNTHLANTLSEYCVALGTAVAQLRDIATRLASRKRDPNAYSQPSYRSDLARYENAVGRYREVGEQLNRSFAR
jgi:hypothetical protein